MLKLGSYLYVHPDDISAVSFTEDDDIEIWVRGVCFLLSSKEAKDDLMDWLRNEDLDGDDE